MGYRDPSPPEPTTIPYGRFRTRKGEWAVGFVVLLFAIGSLVATTHREVFECTRDDGGTVRCEDRAWWLGTLTEDRTFEGDQLSSVEWTTYTGNRNREMGRTDLFDARGRPTSVLSGSRTDAHRRYQRFRRFLDDPTQRSLTIERRPGLTIGLIVGVLALLWVVFIARSIVRTAGRFELVVDEGRGTLTLRARRFRFFRSAIVHPLEGLAHVEVEHGTLRRAHHGRGSKGEPAAQLRLEYEDDLPRKLTPMLLPGSDVHEDLAERLREATGLKPEPRPVVVGEGDAPASAAGQKRHRWLIWLAIGVPLIGVAVAFVAQSELDARGGRVELRSERRCRFQGAELLPGAEMTMTLDPGTYTVELFDPEAPGLWRTDSFEVRAGAPTSYVCR
jgi:hypothetical protein